ncbi:MAG TPA: hypothetical protein VGF44_08390 [Terriglobales bacterium]|jgi:hypothetical protein
MYSRSSTIAGCLFVALSVACAQNTSSPNAQIPKSNSVANNIYRNTTHGFSYKTPYGWVERTQAMQGDAGSSSSHVLLAAFERPPEATGETINSGVVIAEESLAAYPKVKTALDYFEPLTEAVTSQGLKVVNGPHPFAIGNRELIRGDFSKPRGKLTMYQSSLVLMRKGAILSFTFVGGSVVEVDELIENLSFAPLSTSPHH